MSRSATIALLIGIALATTLILRSDPAQIAHALWAAGWGIVLVIVLHTPQTFLSALGLGALLSAKDRPGLGSLYLLRWIREAVNSLLPIMIGGDAVRVRLQILRGSSPVVAVAANVVDLSVELMAQVLFTLAGVSLLIANPAAAGVAPLAWGVLAATSLLVVLLIGAQRYGIVRLAERAFGRLASARLSERVDMTGLHDNVVALYRDRKKVVASGSWHLASWMAGTLETFAALSILGLHPSLSEALVIESLGHAARSAGFLIPGALGVQEGAYVLVGSAFGIGAEVALALSLIRRGRELALGLPGLWLWHLQERLYSRKATREAIS